MDDYCSARASQHHDSLYQQAKYGPRGSPHPYFPLSVHQPEQYQALLADQAAFRAQQWHRAPPAPPAPTSLANELRLAIDTPLDAAPSAHLKTSTTHPLNISALVPPELLPTLSLHLAPSNGPAVFDVHPAFTLDRLAARTPAPPAPADSLPEPADDTATTLARWTRAPLLSALAAALTDTKPAPPSADSLSAIFTLRVLDTKPAPAPRLGPLLLSSCPGKTVRTSAPYIPSAHARPPIARSLPLDLARAHAAGARLLVNLLSDAELARLGAAWPAYAAAARGAGLDVLRLPLAEGCAPSLGSLAEFDGVLAKVIEEYTLQGRGVLVHCRGGVGRAGLLACAWALRLGLCGPVPGGKDARGTRRLVDAALRAVRARRSLKAVETAEQVLFLVRYVEYLRARA